METIEVQVMASRLIRWINNARMNIRNIQDEFARGDVVNPSTMAARQADYFAKIEAWNEVLSVIGREKI